jgi:acetyl-CoA acetyltransferase
MPESRPAVVAGVGTSGFGRWPRRQATELSSEAIHEALADADITAADIDAVYVGSVFGAPGIASRVVAAAGLGGIPTYRIEAACASGTVAFHEAYQSVRLGRHECALAVGVEQLSTVFGGAITPEATDPEGRAGLALPALYALQADRYLHRWDQPATLMAHVAVKNKGHGALNPRAHLKGDPPSLDEVLQSRPIAGELTLLQCCPMSDGAGAAVISRPQRRDHDVTVLGSSFRSGELWDQDSRMPWGFECVAAAAAGAFAEAGLTPDDVDLAEVHDAFTIGEILTIEAVGICKPGTGIEAAASGETALGGRLPVNPSGGLLSRGHPLGATGLAQLAELVWQLRGEADKRQVPGARTALLETMGGGAAGVDGNACVVALLGAPARNGGTEPASHSAVST